MHDYDTIHVKVHDTNLVQITTTVCWQKTSLRQLKTKKIKHRRGFLGMLLGSLGASLLGIILLSKCIIIASDRVIQADKIF